jgi:hypothetical protein
MPTTDPPSVIRQRGALGVEEDERLLRVAGVAKEDARGNSFK